ncbi:MAG: type II CRISPR RNA-guided endonuclease Cas9 [Bacteroidales bacterium]|nr:type II CRISPR RNA-guided endonuclease Cas9 [Bacteroidales bacterium]
MAKILGLDLGTNSIGWAIVDNEKKHIDAAGSRIIPMDGDRMSKFESGGSVSYTEDRTKARGTRRLHERFLLRRERLLRVLNIIGFLPEHFASQLDRYGKLPAEKEPKLAWREGKDGKLEFLFTSSFREMVQEFRAAGIEGNLPYDWTIYYLRKKALTYPLSKEELAWVLLQFNQKRGYFQLRGKQDELDRDTENKKDEKKYCELLVTNVEPTGVKDKKGYPWYSITLENGWIFQRPFRTEPDWKGKTRSFIATFKLDKDGNRKDEQPRLSAPSEDDWGLRKIKTEHDIETSGLTIGEFIYNTLLHSPAQRIIGEKVRVVKRELYLTELHRILDKQREFMPELNDRGLYNLCIESLYPSNDAYRNSIANRDFTYLLADDILFYQRPLKSKTSLISDCPYEKYTQTTKDGEPRMRDGKPVVKPCKCIAKSHPLFQEFRLWQFLYNLKLYCDDVDTTARFLPDNDAYTALFDHLTQTKEIDQTTLFRYFKIGKKETTHYRWNYVTDRKYPCGETRTILLDGIRKAGLPDSFLTTENELQLWHILYSVDIPAQYEKALYTFATKQGLNESERKVFVDAFRQLTVYKEKDYGAYSAKAIGRLLPVMRRGKYWNQNAIDSRVQERIKHLITGEVDDTLPPTARKALAGITDISQCQGLSTWQACYLVYGRHSEASDSKPWRTPEDIDAYLDNFRHNSLNNPVVEQVVTESLRVVRDIWRQHGKPDEIHIELGRELKKTKAERESLSLSIAENEATNQRLRLMLLELMNPDCQVENVRPQSPSQMELLKIYEDGVMRRPEKDIFENESERQDIEDIRKRFAAAKNQPTHSEVLRYKLWLDQKYISPYTGRPIPLGKLFTPAYQIEHVIPQSRWFDDSLSNKVICEAEVNQLKDRELGHEFIMGHHGERVQLSLGGTVEILSVEAYEKLVADLFANNRAKRMKLMLDDIPEDFNARQMNDSRYISRLMMHLLSNIVRTEDEEGNREESVTSKNVIPCNGAITDRLKRDWGIGDVWNRIILPRFERLNTLTCTTDYTTTTANGHTIPTVPLELRQGFNKKRIDHRHHAMDAIVIACTTRDHVSLLNNESSHDGNRRYDLQHKLRHIEYYPDHDGNRHEKFTDFIKPWPTFTEDTYHVLQGIVVSFKQNLRVINKTTNRYSIISNGKRTTVKQEKGDSWAIRKPLHKETVFGEVNLQLKKKVPIKKALENINSIVSRELKEKIKDKKQLGYTDKQVIEFLEKNKDVWSEAADGKVEVYYYTADTGDRYFATRKDLLSLMKDATTIPAAEKAIASITDSGIRSILMAHLVAEGSPNEAFSADGLERMNHNIQQLNGGRPHMPIKKVRVFEQANKFSVGHSGQKATKFVEAAKGTNLFFVIYTNEKGSRGYATVPLNIVIDLQKQYKKFWREYLAERLVAEGLMSAKDSLLYILSPGDLVYVPYKEEVLDSTLLNKSHIYKIVSFTGNYLHCTPASSASVIVNKVEYEAQNKMETTIDKQYGIKKFCIPIQVDRLGNIIKIG